MTLADRNAWAEAKSESLETLQRTASVRVEHRNHDDDGMLTSWSHNMPKKPPPVTADEVGKMIADAKADVFGQIDRRIDAAFKSREWQHEAFSDAVGDALAVVRAELRKEFEEKLGLLKVDVEIAKERANDQAKILDLPSLRSARHG